MSSSFDRAVKDLIQIMTEPKKNKTSPYDTQAEVIRVDGDTAWVHIPGGVDETPVKLTMNAQAGDTVQVRVSGGNAWLQGNATSPPTDDTRANEAVSMSEASMLAAENAIQNAIKAAEAAGRAEVEAGRAQRAADEAIEDAEVARESANSAIEHLSLIEDVVGTLDWISKHGTYIVSSDTEVIENKIYYTLTGNIIENPIGNPSMNGYYEFIDSKYILSTDIGVDSSKTYYAIIANQVMEPSGDPSSIPYYELQINNAITQYINTHLSLTDKGLRVSDGSKASLLISTDGVTIYGNTGNIIGRYGEGAIIGDNTKYHIEIIGDRLSFMNGSDIEIAYMTNNELYIPRVVVVDSMQIGNWIWDAISENNHLTLKWRG